jgi:acetyltransferase-like isoleucine patch superfamily enzyme
VRRDERSPDFHDLDPVRRGILVAFSGAVLLTLRVSRPGHISVGRGVIANHRLRIKGPGRVEIHDRANLYAFRGSTWLETRRPDALIRIGANARLNGPMIQADTLIDIGSDCILGQAHLIDTDMHSLSPDRRTNPEAVVRTAPIVLERNVWVARGAVILPGVTVGENSVIGYGAIVTHDIPASVLAAGNPAAVIRTLS